MQRESLPSSYIRKASVFHAFRFAKAISHKRCFLDAVEWGYEIKILYVEILVFYLSIEVLETDDIKIFIEFYIELFKIYI